MSTTKKFKNSRIRLPRGYSTLSANLGSLIRRKRESHLGGDKVLSKSRLARMTGLTRETIARIERGRMPTYRSITAIMKVLEIEWDEVADKGTPLRPEIKFLAEPLYNLGTALRIGREAKGYSLERLGKVCGLSTAQLSRIERAQVTRSRLIAIRIPDYAHKNDVDDFEYSFKCRLLAGLAQLGADIKAARSDDPYAKELD